MPDERWLRLVDEGAEMDIRHWIFLGGGEPLVRHKLISSMLEKMAHYGMTSWIHTNGTLFTPPMMDNLMGKGVQEIIFSIDGADAQSNDAIRGSGFDKAIANMRYLAQRKKETGLTSPTLLLNATLTNVSYNQLDRFVELAASIEPGVVIFLSGLIVDNEATEQLALNEEQKAQLPELVNKALERAKTLDVFTNFDRFLHEQPLEDTGEIHCAASSVAGKGLAGAFCYEPWLSAAIMPNGQLGPCCAFYDSEALSIRDHSFREVWTGAYMEGVRRSMFNGELPCYCQRCPSNLFIDKENIRIPLSSQLNKEAMSSMARFRATFQAATATFKAGGMTSLFQKSLQWFNFHFRKK
ncbi:MAG: radical SAM protein [Candidatus Hydrogenedentes bacterium]|nr:radical SAM protein [Candidatus Hydrogenedentota bacterium]